MTSEEAPRAATKHANIFLHLQRAYGPFVVDARRAVSPCQSVPDVNRGHLMCRAAGGAKSTASGTKTLVASADDMYEFVASLSRTLSCVEELKLLCYKTKNKKQFVVQQWGPLSSTLGNQADTKGQKKNTLPLAPKVCCSV